MSVSSSSESAANGLDDVSETEDILLQPTRLILMPVWTKEKTTKEWTNGEREQKMDKEIKRSFPQYKRDFKIHNAAFKTLKSNENLSF